MEVCHQSAAFLLIALGVRGRNQKQWVDYVREDLQFAGLSFTWWRKPQGRLEGCHRLSAACGLEGVNE